MVNAGPHPRSEQTTPPIVLAVTMAVLLAAVLRLIALGQKSLWLDEAFSITLAQTPWASFVQQLRTREANMAMYYLVLRAWLHLGLSEWMIRLPSVLAGIATVPLVYAVGARLFGRRAGFIAALILTLDPFHIALSQDARSYPLTILLAVCSSWAFIHVVASPDPATPAGPGMQAKPAPPAIMWEVLYVLTSAGAVYAHFYAGFVLVAQCASLAAWREGRLPWRRLMACWGVIATLLLPIVVFVVATRHGNIDWLAAAVPYVLSHLLALLGTPVGMLGIAYIAVLLTMGWAASRVLRQSHGSRNQWSYALLALWIAAPIVIPIVLSLIIKPVFDPRYAAVSIPAIALLGGAVVDQLPGRRTAVAILAAILLIETAGTATYFARFQKEDWRDATRTVLAAARPGDVVIFYAPYVRRPYDYYADRTGAATDEPQILYPSASYAELRPAGGITLSLPEAIARAQQATRVWLIWSHARSDSACRGRLDATLRAAHHAVEGFTFQGIDVSLYSDRLRDADRADPVGSAIAPTTAIARLCPQA